MSNIHPSHARVYADATDGVKFRYTESFLWPASLPPGEGEGQDGGEVVLVQGQWGGRNLIAEFQQQMV
jgi:hypothetical protein